MSVDSAQQLAQVAKLGNMIKWTLKTGFFTVAAALLKDWNHKEDRYMQYFSNWYNYVCFFLM